MKLKGIFFDLDGTLVDTAPDLCGTIQDMQSDRGVDLTPLSAMQHLASGGARLLLKAGFGLEPSHPSFSTFRAEFLERYQARIARESHTYNGIQPLLSHIEGQGALWGVVTNKPFYLAEQLLAELDLLPRCSVLVGGDTAEHPKPSPAPCLLAAQRLGLNPDQCVMIGDDERDIQAGHAAGMLALAVEYGYIASPVDTWEADACFKTPQALAQWLAARL